MNYSKERIQKPSDISTDIGSLIHDNFFKGVKQVEDESDDFKEIFEKELNKKDD